MGSPAPQLCVLADETEWPSIAIVKCSGEYRSARRSSLCGSVSGAGIRYSRNLHRPLPRPLFVRPLAGPSRRCAWGMPRAFLGSFGPGPATSSSPAGERQRALLFDSECSVPVVLFLTAGPLITFCARWLKLVAPSSRVFPLGRQKAPAAQCGQVGGDLPRRLVPPARICGKRCGPWRDPIPPARSTRRKPRTRMARQAPWTFKSLCRSQPGARGGVAGVADEEAERAFGGLPAVDRGRGRRRLPAASVIETRRQERVERELIRPRLRAALRPRIAHRIHIGRSGPRKTYFPPAS